MIFIIDLTKWKKMFFEIATRIYLIIGGQTSLSLNPEAIGRTHNFCLDFFLTLLSSVFFLNKTWSFGKYLTILLVFEGIAENRFKVWFWEVFFNIILRSLEVKRYHNFATLASSKCNTCHGCGYLL